MMDGFQIVHVLIRSVFVFGGFFYLQHFFLHRRHFLIPSLPALTCLLIGIGFNILTLYDIVLSNDLPEGIEEPFLVQYHQFTEVLVTLVLGSYLLRGVGDPVFNIGTLWKLSVVILAVATNIYMIIRCIKILATSVVLKDDKEYLVYTEISSASNVTVYIFIILPQYITAASIVYFINTENVENKEKDNEALEEAPSVNAGCESCHLLEFYYDLNIIYIGIVIVIVKPILYFYSGNTYCDRSNEFLIVPPFVAVTILFFYSQVTGKKVSKPRTVQFTSEPVYHIDYKKTIP